MRIATEVAREKAGMRVDLVRRTWFRPLGQAFCG
jgi:hypothetical protein